MKTEDKVYSEACFESKWRDYRKKRNILLIIFIGAFTVLPALEIAIIENFKSSYLATGVYIVWMIAIVIPAVQLIEWKCPRCGNWFFYKKLFPGYKHWNPFVRRCMHCKLPKWAKDDNNLK